MDNREKIRYLSSIRSSVENLMGLTQSKQTTKIFPNTCPNVSFPVLDLPFPNHLVATLKTLALNEVGYSKVYRRIQEWLDTLKNLHCLKFQQACRNLASLPHFQTPSILSNAIENLRFAFQDAYASHFPLITAILSAHLRQNPICKSVKTPFNNVSSS